MTKDQDYLKNNNASPLTLSMFASSPTYLEKYNLSPESLRAFLSPDTPPPNVFWGVSTPESGVDYAKLYASSKHKPVAEFFPLTDNKITHDKESQTDETPEINATSCDKTAYEIIQMEGYLIINGVKYIPKLPSPLRHIAVTQTDQSIESEFIEDFKNDKTLQTAEAKMDKTSESKFTDTLQTEKLVVTESEASYETLKITQPKLSKSAEAKRTPDSKTSRVLQIEDIPDTKLETARIQESLITNSFHPTPDSSYKEHNTQSTISNFSVEPPPIRFDMKLIGDDSSDDEFTDI